MNQTKEISEFSAKTIPQMFSEIRFKMFDAVGVVKAGTNFVFPIDCQPPHLNVFI